jgi:hypothetical protein
VIADLIGALIDTIVALFEGDFSKVGEIWTNLWDGLPGPLKDFIGNTLGMFADFFSNTVGMFVDFFTNTFGMFSDFGKNVAKVWNDTWNGLGGIVKDVWNGVIGFVEGGVNTVIDIINNLIRGINLLTGTIGIPKIGLLPNLRFQRLAGGGYFDTPTRALIGESGPEMVVPLRRPLGSVSPSVRSLSALLQGKGVSSTTNNGASIVVEDGAFRLGDVGDPRMAANMVLDRLVARVGTA